MPDIKVRFTGDTSDLQASNADARRTLEQFAASSADLKGSLDQLNASMRQSTVESRTLFGALTSQAPLMYMMRDMVATWRDELAVLSYLNKGFVEEAQATGGALVTFLGNVNKGLLEESEATGRALETALAATPSKIDATAKAMAYGTGETRSFINAQDGVLARLGRTVEGAENAMTAMRLYGGAAAQSALTTIALAGNLDAFAAEATKSGASLSDALAGYMAQIEQIPATSDEAAASIEGMLGSIPNYSAEANTFLIALIRQISATGDEAVANAKKIADAFKDTEGGGRTLGDLVGNLTGLKDIETSVAHIAGALQPSQAAAFYDTILAKLRVQAATQKATNDAAAAALREQGGLDSLMGSTEQDNLDIAVKKNVELQKTIDLLAGQKTLYDQIAAVAARQTTFDETLTKANPTDSQIESLREKRDILQGQLDRNARLGAADTPMSQRTAATALSAEDIATLVRTVIGEAGNQSVQGQLAVAAVAMNRLANGNYGDTLTQVLKAGDGTQFNTWKPADKGGSATDQANAPAPVDSYQFQRVLQDIVMPLLQKQVADPTRGALNFYNPTTTAPQNRFAMTGTTPIGDHLFGTAKGAPAPVAPMDPDEIAKTQQAVEAIDAQIKKLNDTKAGGNALDKAGLEIAQQHATGLRDAVADQQKLVAAAKAEVDGSKNLAPEAQAAAAKKLADAQSALRDKQVEASIGASKVEAAGMEQNSAEEVAVLNRALAEKLALYKQGSAEYDTILGEMSANTKRAYEAQGAMAKAQSEAAILARAATQGADPVAAAQARLAAATQGLTRTGQAVGPQGVVVAAPGGDPDADSASTKDRLAAQTAYYQAAQAARAADTARQHAADELAVAGTKEGTKARLDAQLAMYNREIAAAGDDQAKILGIRRQILEAERAYAKQQGADAAEQENVAYDALQRRFTQERAQIEENARLGQITEAQKASQVMASLDAQLAAAKAHYAALAQIQRDNGTDSPMASLRLAQQAAIAEDRLQAERVAAARAANAEIAQSYKSAFEQAGESVSSSLMQMIQGQARLRDLLRNLALNIVQQFVQARIKVVADWAAGQVAQVAQTVAGEQAKTAATAAGTTARTGLVGMATLEQAALVGVGVVRSILASAAETFAGIFGFLSPIMGPAAAGPAAAGQATVAAVAGAAAFDIGAWSLPSTGLAVVHQGEMIVPAGQTPWAQSLMTAASGGGKGGMQAGPVHFHVTAMDSGDVRRFFANHAPAILGAIKSGVRSGSHLALMRVGRP